MTLYVEAGGAEAMLSLAHAWHERCLQDEVVAHAFSHPGQHPQHLERLAAYWGEALGGPAAYTGSMGTQTHVVKLHSGHGPHEEMDRRGEACFALALSDAGIPSELHDALNAWFEQMNRSIMAAYPDSEDDVPESLELPVRSG